MKVEFSNFSKRFEMDREFIKNIVHEVGLSDQFILKGRVAELERTVGEYIGSRHSVAVSNGTYALNLCLSAMKIGLGDEVLTPAFSFAASASAITLTGARPVFVDIDPGTCMMIPEALEEKVTPATKAVIAVHLFSLLADMPAITEIAKGLGLQIIEDSACSFGAKLNNTFAGLNGDIGVFSFFPAKPLGGICEGGMIVSNDDTLGVTSRMLRNHGGDGKTRFLHHILGYNSRMDELTAAYLIHRLRSFEEQVRRRAEIAQFYNDRFRDLSPRLLTPPDVPYERVHYTYVIQVDQRDKLQAHLAERSIDTHIYYKIPLHLQPAFAYLGYAPGDFPNAERLSERVLALPLYPEMPDAFIEAVVDAVIEFYG